MLSQVAACKRTSILNRGLIMPWHMEFVMWDTDWCEEDLPLQYISSNSRASLCSQGPWSSVSDELYQVRRKRSKDGQ